MKPNWLKASCQTDETKCFCTTDRLRGNLDLDRSLTESEHRNCNRPSGNKTAMVRRFLALRSSHTYHALDVLVRNFRIGFAPIPQASTAPLFPPCASNRPRAPKESDTAIVGLRGESDRLRKKSIRMGFARASDRLRS